MNWLAVFFSLIISTNALAHAQLNCGTLQNHSDQPIPGAPSFAVKKHRSQYTLIQTKANGQVMEFKLVSAQDGDEDYTDYNVVDPKGECLVKSLAIQEKFQWAALIDREGYSVNRCE